MRVGVRRKLTEADVKRAGTQMSLATGYRSVLQMDVSKNSGTPKSSILIWFSIIFTIHFGVPLFLETSR